MSGYTDNLLLRAADVTMKEKRPLVLAARETPMSEIHLRNLYELSRMANVWIGSADDDVLSETGVNG